MLGGFWSQLLRVTTRQPPTRTTQGRRSRRLRPACCLCVESLEDRALLSSVIGPIAFLAPTGQGPSQVTVRQGPQPGAVLADRALVTQMIAQTAAPSAAGLSQPVVYTPDATPNDGDQRVAAGSVSPADKGASQPDDYPLPPANGPALQGDVRVQPRPTAVLLPVQGSRFAVVPTLLTASDLTGAAIAPAEPLLPGPGGERVLLTTSVSLTSPAVDSGKAQEQTNAVPSEIRLNSDLAFWARRSQELALPAGTLGDDLPSASVSTDVVSSTRVPPASVWVATVETRIAETPGQSHEPAADAGHSEVLSLENVRDENAKQRDENAKQIGAVVSAEEVSPEQSRHQNLPQFFLILLLASGTSAACEFAYSVRRAVCKVVRGLRSTQL
jgi:hypothetical protein